MDNQYVPALNPGEKFTTGVDRLSRIVTVLHLNKRVEVTVFLDDVYGVAAVDRGRGGCKLLIKNAKPVKACGNRQHWVAVLALARALDMQDKNGESNGQEEQTEGVQQVPS